MDNEILESIMEAIIEIIHEEMDCHHDYHGGDENYPGHHFIEYNLSDKGVQKIKDLLFGKNWDTIYERRKT